MKVYAHIKGLKGTSEGRVVAFSKTKPRDTCEYELFEVDSFDDLFYDGKQIRVRFKTR